MATSKPGLSLEQRKAHLKKLLHVGRRELGMDEETYRALLVGISKSPERNSSAVLSLQELDLALDRMKAAGFRVKKAGGGRKPATDPLARKVRSLWLQLRDLGALRDPSEAALCKWVEGEIGVADLSWLTSHQAHQVIERLKRWVSRVEVSHGQG